LYAEAPLIPSAYNRAALAAAVEHSRPAILASPRAGTGLELSLMDALALAAHVEVPRAAREEWLAAFVGRRRARLWNQDVPIEEPAEQIRFLAGRIAHFAETELPKLVALGIVHPRALSPDAP
jgi:hypothetical protein